MYDLHCLDARVLLTVTVKNMYSLIYIYIYTHYTYFKYSCNIWRYICIINIGYKNYICMLANGDGERERDVGKQQSTINSEAIRLCCMNARDESVAGMLCRTCQ